MKKSRRIALSAAVGVAALASAGPSHAVYTGAQAIDGPSASILSFSGLDIAPDGTGILVYGKNNGSDRLFASTLSNGAWSAPIPVSGEGNIASANVRVAAGNGGRAVVVWSEPFTGDTVRAAVKPSTAAAFGAPQAAVGEFGPGDLYGQFSVDMSPGGVAYVSAIDSVDSELRAARFAAGSWAPVGGELNQNPAGVVASTGNGPDVDVAADAAGNGVVHWVEGDSSWVRRLTPAAAGPPVLFDAASLDGSPKDPASQTRQIDIDMAGNGVAVATGRQRFEAGDPNRERNIARRLTGNAFGPAIAIDGQGANPLEPGEHGRVDVTVNGAALVASDRGLTKGVFGGPLGGALVNLNPANADDYQFPVPTAGSTGRGVIAAGRQAAKDVVARRWNGSGFEGEQVISSPSFGDATWNGFGTVHGAASDLGDAGFAFVQGAGATKRIVASNFDAPPTAPAGTTSEDFTRDTTPTLTWTPAADAFGGVRSYRVFVDGAQVGTTTGTSFTTAKLASRTHTWSVQAVDRLGQATSSAARPVRIDRRAPIARLKVKGKRRVGKKVKFVVVARAGADGSGLARIGVRFGNGKKKAKVRNIRRVTTFARRYGKAKRYKVRIVVKDQAGNARTLRKTIRIKK